MIIDDSRRMGNGPFELLIGREFKLDIWEEMVRTMRLKEVARFTCPFKVCKKSSVNIMVKGNLRGNFSSLYNGPIGTQ